jgi:glycosyltransferase involved in cell wall biosynthesis
MNILHIVAGELTGGAAKGAYWLHLGLNDIGVNSKILTTSKKNYQSSESKYTINKNKIDKGFSLIRSNLDNLFLLPYRNRDRRIFSTGIFGYDFTKTELYEWADIINLHWINGGFVNIKDLSKVDKPIVWTIRDMWPMTGGCHYSIECDNYKNGCGNCKQLNSNKKYDLSRYVLWRKDKYLPDNLKIVGISDWVSETASESYLFRDNDIRTIYNNVDSEMFFPIDKNIARNILGIETNKKILLAGAQNIEDFYKGFDKYLEAINNLNKEDYFLLFFGNADEELLDTLGFEYKSLGFLYDEVSMRLTYSAADVFIAPSIQEAFGKTIVESLMCETPVVCFDATGPKDLVEHKLNGYKAEPFVSNSLSEGIEWIVSNPDSLNDLRKYAVEKFDNKVIAEKYKKLYKTLV